MQILTDINGLLTGVSIIQGALTVSNQGSSVDLQNGGVGCNALIAFGAPAAAVTGCTAQVEEWNGTTANGSTWTAIPGMVGASVTTGPTTQLLTGLRTQRYARVNAITFAVSTNANVPLTAIILEQPKSEGGASFAKGYSNWPASGSTNGT